MNNETFNSKIKNSKIFINNNKIKPTMDKIIFYNDFYYESKNKNNKLDIEDLIKNLML